MYVCVSLSSGNLLSLWLLADTDSRARVPKPAGGRNLMSCYKSSNKLALIQSSQRQVVRQAACAKLPNSHNVSGMGGKLFNENWEGMVDISGRRKEFKG